MIYANARAWFGGDTLENASLYVEDGRVVAVHRGSSSRADVDLREAVVLPGLIDAHFHLQQLGESMRTIRLEGAATEEEAAKRVTAKAEEGPGGFIPKFKTWLIGGGWDQNLWTSKALPSRATLKHIDQPTVLQRVDFHAIWVNDAALAIAGIDKTTPDPAGGRIVRDSDGTPTGVLIDNACDLVWAHVPPTGDAQIEEDIRNAMKECARFGITCVHDMMMSAETYAVLEGLEKEGELTVRVRAYLHGPRERIEPLLSKPGSPMLRICGVKLFADGALGSRGAALKEPYSDDPSTRGLILMQPNDLDANAAKAHTGGHQVAIHAIGDRAAELAVHAIENAQGTELGRRHRVEHAQTMPPELFERFAKADITASMQPEHCACDYAWAKERLGPERMRGAYAWRTFLEHRVRLALGSDAPIASADPFAGIRAAVVSEHREQRITLREALHGYTSAAAAATHDEATLGVLAAGYAADFVVLSGDPFAGDFDRISVTRTVVNGTTVYEDKQ